MTKWKNIARYPSTATALERWKLLPPDRPPFDEWLVAYSGPITRREGLLTAAKNLLDELDRRYPLSGLCHTERLALAQIVRDETDIPMTRYELYPSRHLADEAFRKMCDARPAGCAGCPYKEKDLRKSCRLGWLYDPPTESEVKEAGHP